MAKNKTAETESSVTDFINSVADEVKRDDSFRLVELMGEITGEPAKMWGPAIIGFGTHHYKYDSGREGDMPLACFSPRKAALVVYQLGKFERREELLQKLGKHKTDKGCVSIKKLADVDMDVLKEMITNSMARAKSYPL